MKQDTVNKEADEFEAKRLASDIQRVDPDGSHTDRLTEGNNSGSILQMWTMITNLVALLSLVYPKVI